MRMFTRIAAATVLAGGLTVSGAGAALADPREEGILGHVLSDLLGPHVPDAGSLQADPSPADTGAPEANTPGGTMTPAPGTGDALP
ncbi:hypothetical protein [Nocardiopsis quinghaiensis]|uniref:hypothetical protein n=1 Tax=Nocardiopsis quinghaiensis TaxID=464995 RepID=UPI00123A87AA|nr:hypothetical protein [Nocardiopsis quinghaiensis]